MSELADFHVAPPLRCFAVRRNPPGKLCGKRAAFMRAPVNGGTPEYFCDEHHAPTDTIAPAEPVFRRVRIVLEVYMAGASLVHATAVRDALEQLEAAIRQAGGVHGLVDATSSIGQAAPPAGARRARAEPEGV